MRGVSHEVESGDASARKAAGELRKLLGNAGLLLRNEARRPGKP
jgi:hypothetical protein